MVALGETILYQAVAAANSLGRRDRCARCVETPSGTGVPAGQVIAQYTYNAQGYAVTATYPQGTSQLPVGTTNYLYYTTSWQLIEIRSGGTASNNVAEQIVWSAAYINAAVLQDTYSNGVIQPNSRLYFIQDANWNTTAVVGYNPSSGTWGVVQRYVYSPYGNITILNPDFTVAASGTAPLVNNLYQGMAQDPVTGLYYERARWYSPSLGTWVSQDPAGYVNGADTYQFVMGNPVARVDPGGLAAVTRAQLIAYIEGLHPQFSTPVRPPSGPSGGGPFGPTGPEVGFSDADCAELQREAQHAILDGLLAQEKALSALLKLYASPPPCPAERAKLDQEYHAASAEEAADLSKVATLQLIMGADRCRNGAPGPGEIPVPVEPAQPLAPPRLPPGTRELPPPEGEGPWELIIDGGG